MYAKESIDSLKISEKKESLSLLIAALARRLRCTIAEASVASKLSDLLCLL